MLRVNPYVNLFGGCSQDIFGGYGGGVPPLPIPNREVKPTCADGTAMQCGRVGSRLLLTERVLRRKSWNSFFCLLLLAVRVSLARPLLYLLFIPNVWRTWRRGHRPTMEARQNKVGRWPPCPVLQPPALLYPALSTGEPKNTGEFF